MSIGFMLRTRLLEHTIQLNSLFTLELTSRSKAIAFAGDLIIPTRGETVAETEIYMNLELRKIRSGLKIIK